MLTETSNHCGYTAIGWNMHIYQLDGMLSELKCFEVDMEVKQILQHIPRLPIKVHANKI